MTERINFYSCVIVAFVVGATLTYLLDGVWFDQHEVQVSRSCAKNFPNLSPILDCEDSQEKFEELEGLSSDIRAMIEEEKETGRIKRASFFFRDLNSRRFVGVDASDIYYPASLLKLPIAIMYHKIAEAQQEIMDKKLVLTEEHLALNGMQAHQPKEKLAAGEYPIRTLIEYMIKYSQNAPVKPLTDFANRFANTILNDIGIYIPPLHEGEEGVFNVSARSYANLFRILYNSAYLSLEHSNQMLDLLSQSDFDGGIAKIPAGVKVAHKFGEVTFPQGENGASIRGLHHCGIVYKPGQPYIICIMTEGKDFGELKAVIERIATYVYEEQ